VSNSDERDSLSLQTRGTGQSPSLLGTSTGKSLQSWTARISEDESIPFLHFIQLSSVSHRRSLNIWLWKMGRSLNWGGLWNAGCTFETSAVPPRDTPSRRLCRDHKVREVSRKHSYITQKSWRYTRFVAFLYDISRSPQVISSTR
jgi:hypothetical protein